MVPITIHAYRIGNKDIHLFKPEPLRVHGQRGMVQIHVW
jgi:hypothetical protein